ncbi:MAG: mechanosensitive ion channel family protein [Deltaproteobacteria bacterium]
MIPRNMKVGLIVMLMVALAVGSALPCVAAAPGKQEGEKAAEPKSVQAVPKPAKSPQETATVDSFATRISSEVNQIGSKASSFFGKWIGYDALGSITWFTLGSCLLLIFVVVLFERVVRILIRARIRRVPEEERAVSWTALLLEAICEPLSLFIWVYGIYAALSPLIVHFEHAGVYHLPIIAKTASDFGGTIAILWFIYRLIHVADMKLGEWIGVGEVKTEELLVRLVGKTLRIFVIVVGGIMLIQNFTGIRLGPLLASLGLGGLAVALAAKDSIANLFGTVTIILDKPFEIGERVVVDKYDGVIENVGYRSTRIRTLTGHVVCIPNEKIISSAIENVDKRPYLRWYTNVTLTYDTAPDKVERAVQILREILDNHEGMVEDLPPRVHFNAFNDWNLNIAILAWYHPAAWWDDQAWLQRTCLEIMRRFEMEGIDFAFPSQTMYLANDDRRQLKLQVLKGEDAGNRGQP